MCSHPISLSFPDRGFNSFVRCGRCWQCRNRRRWQWIGRLLLESQCHENARFLTLTYRDDPGVLDPRELSNFMKRYRYHYGECRFFGVGEYGEKNGRGHFHLIVFGHAAEVVGHWACPAWDRGYCFDGSVTVKSISYVGGYVMKTGDNKEHRPFVRCSLRPGLGFSRIHQMAVACPKDIQVWPQGYYIGAKKFPLCEGGLAKFKVSYLESGGLPPASSNPETMNTLWWLKSMDRGTRLSELEASYIDAQKERDSYGVPSR